MTEPVSDDAGGRDRHDGGATIVDAVVVGAGVAGLTAAHDLVANGHATIVAESSGRIGGKVWARDLAGHAVDVGADSMLARHRAGVDLANRLGLEMAHPATGTVQLLVDGRLRQLPSATMLGAPTDLVALARSGVLSPRGLGRAALEAVWPRHQRTPGDRSVADVVGARYGHEVVERLVEPLLGGIYAGRPDQLSVRATTPVIATADVAGHSLAHGLRHAMAARCVPGPVFAAPTTSMASFVAALATQVDRIGSDRGPAQDRPDGGRDGSGDATTPVVRTGVTVSGLTATTTGDWLVETDGGERWQAATVVVAVPAHVAATLLARAAPGTAAELAGVRHASVGVVSLHYGAAGVDDLPAASGILVPRREGRLVKAATWLARKWPHLADRGAVLRASVGRIDDHRWRELDDDELARTVDHEVRTLTGLGTSATSSVVTRWHDALPQYEVGHRERIDRARHGLPVGILLAGAAHDGIGVSPCVASGHQAAWGAMQELARR